MAFSFYHKPHTSDIELITYRLGRDEGVDNVLKCFDGFCSVINLPHANNVFNIINICIIGRVKVILRVKITDSSSTESCLVTDLSIKKTRIKQSNNIKGFGRNQLLLGGM